MTFNVSRILTAAWLLNAAMPAAFAAPTEGASQLLRDRVEQLVTQDGTRNTDDVQFAAPEVLLAFYQSREFAPAWDDARARAFTGLAANAAAEGLDPADYLYPMLAVLPPPSTLPDGERVNAELVLTEAFLRYAYHGRFGKVDPRALEPTWNYARNVSSGEPYAALERVLAADDMKAQIEIELGHGPVYAAMRRVLERYRKYAEQGEWPVVPPGNALKAGMTGPRVAALRARLAAEDFGPGSGDSSADIFDAGLEAALREFQERHGLGTDGVAGKRTIDELNVSAASLVDRLRINLERLRWVLLQKAPKFVAANVAGARVYYIEGDDVRWSARAVVGKAYRRTPVFRADMTYIVLNPDWTVPPTILRKDVLPAIARDEGYLAQKHMDVVDRNGRIVDPGTIDWQRVNTRAFPYSIRQRPGDDNSLGRVKFIFPNPHFVFLHDTPSRELFERDERLLSSGCIRVQHPLELAEILLSTDAGWTRERLMKAVETRTMQTVFLKQPVPVMLMYLTAIAFDGGRDFTFYRDVYNRDAEVLEALDAGFVYSPPEGLATAARR